MEVVGQTSEAAAAATASDAPRAIAAASGQDEATPDVCGVCMDLLDTKAAVQLVPCPHSFHRSCIIEWLESRDRADEQTCPMCRMDVYEIRSRTHTLPISQLQTLGGRREPSVFLAIRCAWRRAESSVVPFLTRCIADTQKAIAQWTWIREEAAEAGAALPYSHTEDASGQLEILEKRLVTFRQMKRIADEGGLRLEEIEAGAPTSLPSRSPRARFNYRIEYVYLSKLIARWATLLEEDIVETLRSASAEVPRRIRFNKAVDIDSARLLRLHAQHSAISREREEERPAGERACPFWKGVLWRQRGSIVAERGEEEAAIALSFVEGTVRGGQCALCDTSLDRNERVIVTLPRCQHKYHRQCIVHFLETRTRRSEQCCPICRLLHDRTRPHVFMEEYPMVPALGPTRIPTAYSVQRGSLELRRPLLSHLTDLIELTKNVIGAVREQRDAGIAHGFDRPLVYTKECDMELRWLERRLTLYRQMQRFQEEGGSLVHCKGVWDYEQEVKRLQKSEEEKKRKEQQSAAASARLPPAVVPQQATAATDSIGHCTLDDFQTLVKVFFSLRTLGVLSDAIEQQTEESHSQMKMEARPVPRAAQPVAAPTAALSTAAAPTASAPIAAAPIAAAPIAAAPTPAASTDAAPTAAASTAAAPTAAASTAAAATAAAPIAAAPTAAALSAATPTAAAPSAEAPTAADTSRRRGAPADNERDPQSQASAKRARQD